jgi:hypothetical protein
VMIWKSRGVSWKHTVTDADIATYTTVPMHTVSKLPSSCHVLACYGWVPNDHGLIDGVVPVTDIAGPTNALGRRCTLKLVLGAGHNVREDGAAEKLANIVETWIRKRLDSRPAHARL